MTPVDKFSVAFTILLSVLFLGETLTLKSALGAVLIIAGTLVLILQGRSVLPPAESSETMLVKSVAHYE